MKGYDIIEWLKGFEKDGGKFDFKVDALLSKSRVLMPGRFYILEYMAQTKETYNARPIIISLGLSKKDPDSFLCVDLCLIPRNMRLKFVEIVFKMFERQISENMEKFWNVEDADKQKQIISFCYEMFDKMPILHPIKKAIKKYKMENTYKIYSIPFSRVYKIIGELPDINCMVNGVVAIEQQKFLMEKK